MTPLLWPLWWLARRSSASSTVTRTPRPASAMAGARPTRPPPATATSEEASVMSGELPAASLLIGADQLGPVEDVPGHRILQPRLGGPAEIGQLAVEGVELEEVAVASDRRTRPAVAGALPVVQAFAGAGRQVRGGDSPRQAGGGNGDVVEHPMDPGGLRCPRIGRVRIVDDQRQAARRLRRARPGESGRDVLAFAGEAGRDLPVGLEVGGCQGERHVGHLLATILSP